MHEIILKNMTSKDKRFNETLISKIVDQSDAQEIFERRTISKILHVLKFLNDGTTEAFLRKELAAHCLPETYFIHLVDHKTSQEVYACKMIGYQYIVLGSELFIVRISCDLRKTIKRHP